MRRVVRGVALVVVGLLAPHWLAAQTLRSAVFGERDRATVELFADANLKSLLAQNTGGSPQSAAGSVGLAYRTESVLAQLLVNAVGQSDPVRRNFGASLLLPASGPSLGAGLLDLAFRFASLGSVCQSLAIHAYGSVSSGTWIDAPAGATSPEYGTIVGGAGGALRCVLFSGSFSQDPDRLADAPLGNRVAAFVEVGPSFRTIGGEIADADNNDVRVALLNTTEKGHWGVEATLGLEVNGVKAGVTYYGFWNEVPGMSDGQVVAGLSVESALLRGFLNRPRPSYSPPRRRR
jgi:hypothetical protein